MASRPFRPRYWQGQNEEKKKTTRLNDKGKRQPVRVVNPPPEAAKNESSKEQNEKMCRITEEKTKRNGENNRSIEDLELSKKVTKDKLLLE